MKHLINLMRNLVIPYLNREYMPFPLDKKICSGWARDLPRGGDTIIYTGCMYQSASILALIEKYLPIIYKSTFLQKLFPLMKILKPNSNEIERAYRILNNISTMLMKNNIKFGYLYEEEPYSGALLLELGLLNEFKEYSLNLIKFFKSKGVKKIITVDPHSYHALLKAKELHNAELEIYNYLEFINNNIKSLINTNEKFVIHDSCLYYRFHNFRKYKEIIEKAGFEVQEDWLTSSKENGICCGYPIHLIDKELSEKIAKCRVNQLNKISKNIIVVCPFCYLSLSKFSKIVDIAEILG